MHKKKSDQAGRYDLITYKSIHKTVTGQGDDFSSDSLLDYNYFKNYF